MTIDSQLLEILVCPEDKSPVHLADDAVVADLNQRISAGAVRDRSGTVVKERIDGGLIRKDGRVLYPIRSDIPIMITGNAIELRN